MRETSDVIPPEQQPKPAQCEREWCHRHGECFSRADCSTIPAVTATGGRWVAGAPRFEKLAQRLNRLRRLTAAPDTPRVLIENEWRLIDKALAELCAGQPFAARCTCYADTPTMGVCRAVTDHKDYCPARVHHA